MFESAGRLEYHDSGWLILKCCKDLARYYRNQIKKKCLGKPRAGSHITVVNGTVEYNNIVWDAWRKHENKDIVFKYNPVIKSQDQYYWLTVYCEELLDIREELGLNRFLKHPLHLTLAREQV